MQNVNIWTYEGSVLLEIGGQFYMLRKVMHMSVGLLKETGDVEFHPSLRALDDLLPFDLEF